MNEADLKAVGSLPGVRWAALLGKGAQLEAQVGQLPAADRGKGPVVEEMLATLGFALADTSWLSKTGALVDWQLTGSDGILLGWDVSGKHPPAQMLLVLTETQANMALLKLSIRRRLGI